MKGIIRKILLEYNGEDVFTLNPKELKLFSYLIENNFVGIENDDFMNIGDIKIYIHRIKDILTPDLIEKLFFLLLFNKPSDILKANNKKNTDELYLGNFYISNVVHYGEWSEDSVDVTEECEYCDGYGEEKETCGECRGHGYIEDEEDDEFIEYTCDTCGGSGEESITCNYCGGGGEQTYWTSVFEIDEISEVFITKDGINEDDIESTWDETYRIMVRNRDKYFFTGYSDYFNSLQFQSDKLRDDDELLPNTVTNFDSKSEEIKPNIGFRNFLFKNILKLND